MTELEWKNLQLGDLVHLPNSETQWAVSEIATDERSVQNWINRGFQNIDRIIKFDRVEGDPLHSWDCWRVDKWEKI